MSHQNYSFRSQSTVVLMEINKEAVEKWVSKFFPVFFEEIEREDEKPEEKYIAS